MKAAEVISAIRAAIPTAGVEWMANPSPSGQDGILVATRDALEVARFLRDSLRLDFASNATGLDWPPRKVRETKDGPEVEVPGFLEVVYHLFSISGRFGPVILRLRTADRELNVTLPSLTPVWKSLEFQEREIFDLIGIRFAGHPDLRRLLMWDEFTGHPLRKDYVAPDGDSALLPTP